MLIFRLHTLPQFDPLMLLSIFGDSCCNSCCSSNCCLFWSTTHVCVTLSRSPVLIDMLFCHVQLFALVVDVGLVVVLSLFWLSPVLFHVMSWSCGVIVVCLLFPTATLSTLCRKAKARAKQKWFQAKSESGGQDCINLCLLVSSVC